MFIYIAFTKCHFQCLVTILCVQGKVLWLLLFIFILLNILEHNSREQNPGDNGENPMGFKKKTIRLHSRPFHRLDDFVVQYQHMHSAQLREFVDTGKKKKSKGL